ncbi:hypothetical protein EA794_10460 [Lactococcus petauri]|uniref:hypothetical protein n=1 Tax=Lactococcus petauri TaxID=1940789 RepID=UPI0013FE1D05|nr:hypothetical protein [Lactococcus petauri]NHI76374.1 hypothetical protein [Lactococcus petauri]
MRIGGYSILDIVFIVISIIYTIMLYFFKKSNEEITKAYYNNIWDRASAISHITNYWSYLGWGVLVLLVLVIYGGMCAFHSGFSIEIHERLGIGILNSIVGFGVWRVFYDPIFTTFLVIALGLSAGSYMCYQVVNN